MGCNDNNLSLKNSFQILLLPLEFVAIYGAMFPVVLIPIILQLWKPFPLLLEAKLNFQSPFMRLKTIIGSKLYLNTHKISDKWDYN